MAVQIVIVFTAIGINNGTQSYVLTSLDGCDYGFASTSPQFDTVSPLQLDYYVIDQSHTLYNKYEKFLIIDPRSHYTMSVSLY